MKYIYPKLPGAYTTPFFRVGGNGLANCLFVYAKAVVEAYIHRAQLIRPTWFNLSLGTYIRRQSDKRHYLGLINGCGEVGGVKRLWLLIFCSKTIDAVNFDYSSCKVLTVEGIYDFFRPLIPHHNLVRMYLLEHINKRLLSNIEGFNFNGCVAVHVRLGDFPMERRIPMEWYVNKIQQLRGRFHRFLLFSDGSDEELRTLTCLLDVERVFFGSAIQDIIAISRCHYLIGSDSSFSAWGAYLGQIPCSFYRLQFGEVLFDSSQQSIEVPYDVSN